jgi:hypothetical protein
VCKTCKPCRQKKVKCDGSRPSCKQCDASTVHCTYPRDNRRESRPSSARVENLENTLGQLLKHMQTAGMTLPSSLNNLLEVPQPPTTADSTNDDARDRTITVPLPTPAGSTASPVPSGVASALPLQSTGALDSELASTMQREAQSQPCTNMDTLMCEGVSRANTDCHTQQWSNKSTGCDIPVDNENSSNLPSLSHCEARVAGVFHEQGCVSSVHGLSGMINPNLRALHKKNISSLQWQGGSAISESRARLISNAALQKQRESRLFRSPSETMDLDGCAPKLAEHLLGLHFNRHHYAYVLTYRPAFMDSLGRGGGPFMNKLLLNAIYYSSTMFSDWAEQDESHVQNDGEHFYTRFKALLVDEIDRPSTATAAALLIMSGALIARGRSSAGWTFSGTAYRMIMDLGCHMMIGADYGDGRSTSQLLRVDMEREMRKRLYWGAFATDASQALYLGRPCMFACQEARVPLQFLDTLEEYEIWIPQGRLRKSDSVGSAYEAQPAHAVSTFIAMAQLLKISTKITDLYGIQSIKLNTDTLLEKLRSIEWELDKWKSSLPLHLYLDPETFFVPPPHQITPQ